MDATGHITLDLTAGPVGLPLAGQLRKAGANPPLLRAMLSTGDKITATTIRIPAPHPAKTRNRL